MNSDKCEKIGEVIDAFTVQGKAKSCERYGSGHINDTFRLVCEDVNGDHHYILQRMNHDIFKDPISLMKNVEGVTIFLRNKIIENGGDPNRETLNLVPAKDGGTYYQDSSGNYWRLYLFIEWATCYDLVEKPEHFYQSGKAFGHFQKLLADYPADQLSETIPNFHNTPSRVAALKKAIQEDILGRAQSVQDETKFYLDREDETDVAVNLLKEGKVPLRVTHNDTKLNNIMIDDTTGEALCIIDLDTIMPGFSFFDFGDSIRFGANTGAEDEKDLRKVSLSLLLYDVYTKGFLEGCQGRLTAEEVGMLSMGAKLMTMECGIRFLTDYLQGDVYFKIDYENHNLDRTRTQIALTADMERKWDEMEAIVKKYQ